MTFKADLYTYLNANVALTALVVDRFYPGQAPETVSNYPFVVMSRISSEGSHHMEAATKVAIDTYQFDVWAITDESREAVSEAIREALDGFRGIMGASTEIRRIIIKNQLDTIIDARDGSQIPNFRTVLDFDFIYNRSVPTFP